MTLSNMLLAATDNIELGSNFQVGDANYCDSGEGEVYMFTQGLYNVGPDPNYSGVQIVAATDVKTASTNSSLKGIAVQAGNRIDWGSNNTFGGCYAPALFIPANTFAIVQ